MKKLLLVGAGAACLLTVVAVVGAVLEWWWLVVAAAMVLLSCAFLAALDADRRARALRPLVLKAVSSAGSVAAERVAPPVSEADVVGAVRVLQAQYTGRLDRMQAALDQAVTQLRAEGQRGHDEKVGSDDVGTPAHHEGEPATPGEQA
ncbi:hypothetical protein MWU75_19470 [Ornithinimicrobium sp. F0845]|uniref:hypothetical protein n=1 Tax=Ornithinimicrobium sp. F0845 TaxID=2926412 RepID=UPI001FF1E07A|nr:hypothetical protein [Ornithinimicrobium sp. F0845]MCK0114322.1 hypothetical protein [Ornithinimicrobium sp. F0845]